MISTVGGLGRRERTRKALKRREKHRRITSFLPHVGGDYLMLAACKAGGQRASDDQAMDLYPSRRYITLGN